MRKKAVRFIRRYRELFTNACLESLFVETVLRGPKSFSENRVVINEVSSVFVLDALERSSSNIKAWCWNGSSPVGGSGGRGGSRKKND